MASRHAAKDLACTQCTQTFTRPSHLQRHLQSHLSRRERDLKQCPRCERCFSRHDVLLRHLRSYHDLSTENIVKINKKSCERCIKRKTKCDRQLPCSTCKRAAVGSECCFIGVEQQRLPIDSADLTTLSHEKTPETQMETDTMLDSELPAQNMAILDSSFDAWTNSPSRPNWTGQLLSPSSCDPEPFLDPLMQLQTFELQLGDLDWLDTDLVNTLADAAAVVEQTAHSMATPSMMPNTQPFWANEPSLQTPRSETYASDRGGRAGNQPQQWPFDEDANDRANLPSLQALLRGVMPSGPSQTHQTGIPSSKGFADAQRRAVEAYFTVFHDILPVIHVPSFHTSTSPDVLKAAMSCLGSIFVSEKSTFKDAVASSQEYLRQVAVLADVPESQGTAYLTASCLHQIFSLGSGDRQLYHHADRSRSLLFSGLRSIGVMGMTGNNAKYDLKGTDPETTHQLWLEWIESEHKKRLVWSSFEYDCSLCTLTSRRAAVDISELPSFLPCCDALWKAPTAQSWRALMVKLPDEAKSASTHATVRRVLSGLPPLPDLPFWSQRLCTQVIGRQLWDIRQGEKASMADCFMLPSLRKAQIETKQHLLAGLQILTECTSSPADTVGLVNSNIISLILHYSHLYCSGDTLDLIIYIFRTSASSSGADGSVAAATQTLYSRLHHNPQATRRLAWHAAQIVAAAQEYLVSAPCEILRIFMGYIFLVAFASLGPHASLPGSPTSVNFHVSEHNSTPCETAEQWIQHGGRLTVGTLIDTQADGELLKAGLTSIMARLGNWGLSEKFSKIVNSFDLAILSPDQYNA